MTFWGGAAYSPRSTATRLDAADAAEHGATQGSPSGGGAAGARPYAGGERRSKPWHGKKLQGKNLNVSRHPPEGCRADSLSPDLRLRSAQRATPRPHVAPPNLSPARPAVAVPHGACLCCRDAGRGAVESRGACRCVCRDCAPTGSRGCLRDGGAVVEDGNAARARARSAAQ